MKQNLYGSATIALVVGVAQTYILLFCWGYIAAYSPILEWLLGFGLRGGALRAVVYPIDFLTNVALSLPAAVLLVKLRPPRLALFLVVAVVPSFVWLNLHLVGSPMLAEFWPSFAFGWFQSLLALPVAAWLVSFVVKPSAPNQVLQGDALNARA